MATFFRQECKKTAIPVNTTGQEGLCFSQNDYSKKSKVLQQQLTAHQQVLLWLWALRQEASREVTTHVREANFLPDHVLAKGGIPVILILGGMRGRGR